ncbi:MAG: DHH family phosphoesterase, partial [Lachnospiraceae bacterium]|nr:DHH family phosphoesterase [Lachnospiraceae bacterium]
RENMDSHKQLAEGVMNTEIYKNGFAISRVNPDGIEAPTVMAAKIANDLLDVDGVRASFVVTRQEDTAYISARSVDDMNVQVAMEKLGGGGHANVAGAQLKGESIESAVVKIKELLDEMYKEGDI